MRLDSYLCQNGYYTSRTKAVQAIEKGQVTVNGRVQKPSYTVVETDKIEILEKQKFVSLGGYKLEKALIDLNIDVSGMTFVDVGASTGGFTDCLLQFGAKKVYALDVGESQLDNRLKLSENVVVVDNTNARFVDEKTLPEQVSGAVVDCSFISLKMILQPISKLLKSDGIIIALIKPQFECGKENLNKNGIVKDIKVHKVICRDIFDFAESLGYKAIGFTVAPKVAGKNVEYLILLGKTGKPVTIDDILKILND